MEPGPASAAEGEVLVAYGLFTLQEEDGPLAVEIDYSDREIVAGGASGAVLISAVTDHYPLVRIEVWPAEPPPSGEEWDVITDDAFEVAASRWINLAGLLGLDSAATRVRLPRLGSYRLRVHVRGRREAAARGEAQFFHGVEQWLLQTWPRDPAPVAVADDEDLPEWEMI